MLEQRTKGLTFANFYFCPGLGIGLAICAVSLLHSMAWWHMTGGKPTDMKINTNKYYYHS
jgi:hypothetical protein